MIVMIDDFSVGRKMATYLTVHHYSEETWHKHKDHGDHCPSHCWCSILIFQEELELLGEGDDEGWVRARNYKGEVFQS